jgi:hypothetical protein
MSYTAVEVSVESHKELSNYLLEDVRDEGLDLYISNPA